MRVSELENVLVMIDVMLESGHEEEVTSDLLIKFYDLLVAKYRPLLQVVPVLAEKLGADAAGVGVTFLRLVNSASEDESFQDERRRMFVNRARSRADALQTYLGVGFSRAEAMQLLLTDAANAKTAQHNAGQNFGKGIGPSSK